MDGLNLIEHRFVQVYGHPCFHRISEFIQKHDLLDYYLKARQSPHDLFEFGFHYGIIEIVAFCYCVLECPIEITSIIQGYYQSLTSSPDQATNDLNAVPVETSGGRSGIIIGTLDKFTASRNECIKFMIRMQKFSRCKLTQGKFVYQIVNKYVEQYRLLDVY
jgi:hypothetical protein